MRNRPIAETHKHNFKAKCRVSSCYSTWYV